MTLKNCINVIFIILILSSSSGYAYVLSYDAHIAVSEEYNDNIFLAPDNTADDYITVVSPGLRSDIRWQRVGMSASYDLGYSFYNTYSENDSLRHLANVGCWWDVFQNTHLRLGDTFIKTEDVADLPYADIGQTSRNVYYSNSTQLDLEQQFGERRNFLLSYVYSTLQNEDVAVEDNQSHHVSSTLNYFFTPWIGSQTQFSYTKGLYDVSQDFDEWIGSFRLIKVISRHLELNAAYEHTFMRWEGQGLQNDYQVYHPSIGMNYTFDNETALSINAGYFVQDIDSRENEKGLTLDGNIGKTWTFRSGLINVSGSSGYEQSQLNTENLGFTVYYGAASQFEYSFSREVTSSIDLNYRNNDYVNPAPGNPDRTDKIMSASSRVNWQIKRWLGSSLEYSYRNLDSNIHSNDYIENRIKLTFILTVFQRNSPAVH